MDANDTRDKYFQGRVPILYLAVPWLNKIVTTT